MSAPIPSALHTADWPGVTTRVDVGPAGRVVGGAVCAWVGGAVGGDVGAGAGGNVGGCVGACVGGGVAWVGRGSGAAVVAGGAVDAGWPVVVGGASVEVVSDVIRGIVSSGDASRESAHAVVTTTMRIAVAPARLQLRTLAWMRSSHASSIGEAAALTKSSPKWCLVHCGAVPSKRLIVLTGLAVVAGALVTMSAVGGGDGGDPQRLAPVPDHPPADVASTPLSSPPSTADAADTL